MICLAPTPIWCDPVINPMATSMWRGWGWYCRKGHSPSANATLPSTWGGPTHKRYLFMLPKCIPQPHTDWYPTYNYAQIWACLSHATPVCVGGTQPHTDGAPNIHLPPNTAVLSTPTPLPSAWGAQHINGTSSCR